MPSGIVEELRYLAHALPTARRSLGCRKPSANLAAAERNGESWIPGLPPATDRSWLRLCKRRWTKQPPLLRPRCQQLDHLTSVALALILIVVVEDPVHDFGVSRELARPFRDLDQFLRRVVVVESFCGRAQALQVPSTVIASVKAHDSEIRVRHFPHRRNRIGKVGRRVDDDVDQPTMPLEVECCSCVLAFEPGPVTKLDCKLMAF